MLQESGVAADIFRTLLTILAAVYLASMMLALGLELGAAPKEERDSKRRKRRVLVGAVLLNLLVLPALAVGITSALHTASDVSVALLLLVCAPGGRFAPQLVKLGGGELGLSVELTLWLAKLTSLTGPLTAKWLLELHSLEVRELPFLLQLVLLQFVPFYLGKWLRRRRASLAQRLARPANTIAIVAALVVLAAVLLEGDRGIIGLLGDRGWVAVIAVCVAAPLLGWLVAGKDDRARRALSIAANAREGGLALVISNIAFPGRHMQTALFGVWSASTLAAVLFAWAVGHGAPRHLRRQHA